MDFQWWVQRFQAMLELRRHHSAAQATSEGSKLTGQYAVMTTAINGGGSTWALFRVLSEIGQATHLAGFGRDCA